MPKVNKQPPIPYIKKKKTPNPNCAQKVQIEIKPKIQELTQSRKNQIKKPNREKNAYFHYNGEPQPWRASHSTQSRISLEEDSYWKL